MDAETLKVVKALSRQAGTLWLGSRRATAAQIENQDPLDLMIWMDGQTNELRTGMVAPRQVGGDAMLTSLVQAMTDPAGDLKPYRPGRIAVEDKASRAYLEEWLASLDIEIVPWQGSTMLDEAFANMEATLSRGPGPTYLAQADNTPESVGRLFAAAVSLFDTAPWEGREESQLACLTGLDPSPLYVSMLGGMEYGLAIFLTREAARLAVRSSDPIDMQGQPILMLTYVHPDETGPGLLIEASDHGWSLVDAECLPLLGRADRLEDFVAHGADVVLATDVANALATAFRSGHKFKPGPVKLKDGRSIHVDWPSKP